MSKDRNEVYNNYSSVGMAENSVWSTYDYMDILSYTSV